MPEHLLIQREDALAEASGGDVLQGLLVDLHAAVHHVDKGEELALGAGGAHGGPELRLAVVGE